MAAGEVGAGDVTHLASLHQQVRRFKRLVHGSQRVESMHVVIINLVRAETLPRPTLVLYLGLPLRKTYDALGKRQLLQAEFLPKLKLLGLAWANFQVMRRTHSSLLKELDLDPQVRAEQMRHTIDVNESVYAITSLSRRRDAVNTLEKAIGA